MYQADHVQHEQEEQDTGLSPEPVPRPQRGGAIIDPGVSSAEDSKLSYQSQRASSSTQ